MCCIFYNNGVVAAKNWKIWRAFVLCFCWFYVVACFYIPKIHVLRALFYNFYFLVFIC